MNPRHLFVPSCLCAFAPLSQAQTWQWLADVSAPEMDPFKGVVTQDVTLSVYMEFDTPFLMLSYAIFDTLGAVNADYGQITEWEILNGLADLTGDLTTTDGVSLYDTNVGQLCLFTHCDTSNPIEVLSFTWQLDVDAPLDAPFDVVYSTNTQKAGVSAGDDMDSAKWYPVEFPLDVTFGWTVVPAPATTFLGAGALAITRRRRCTP